MSLKFGDYYNSLESFQIVAINDSVTGYKIFIPFKLNLDFEAQFDIYDKEEVFLKVFNDFNYKLVSLPTGITDLNINTQIYITSNFKII